MKYSKYFKLFVILLLVVDLAGCESFVRKFTRKKKQEGPTEELVLVPEEYKDTRTAEAKYREHFTYWKAWQDELVESLLMNKSLKKRVDCAEQALKHLSELKPLLIAKKQQELSGYLARLADLRDMISDDTYGTNNHFYRNKAENIRRNVLQHFSYPGIGKSVR
ncbi:MAG: hypothetical protein NT060_02555 [Candidatus Omnitrophica bacterium]|nr:hypothetical protein [Candidatus Omnitrophota bacterium]